MAEQRDRLGFRKALDRIRVDQIDQQGDRCLGDAGHVDDADPAQFHAAAQDSRRRRDKDPAARGKIDTVIRHQHGAALDQPQGQIRFTGARRTAQNHPGAVEDDAARMDLVARCLGHFGPGGWTRRPGLVNVSTAAQHRIRLRRLCPTTPNP